MLLKFRISFITSFICSLLFICSSAFAYDYRELQFMNLYPDKKLSESVHRDFLFSKYLIQALNEHSNNFKFNNIPQMLSPEDSISQIAKGNSDLAVVTPEIFLYLKEHFKSLDNYNLIHSWHPEELVAFSNFKDCDLKQGQNYTTFYLPHRLDGGLTSLLNTTHIFGLSPRGASARYINNSDDRFSAFLRNTKNSVIVFPKSKIPFNFNGHQDSLCQIDFSDRFQRQYFLLAHKNISYDITQVLQSPAFKESLLNNSHLLIKSKTKAFLSGQSGSVSLFFEGLL